MTNEEKMMDILQSFVDLAEPQLDKYDNLKEDVEATKWAINKIKTLEAKCEYLQQRYLEFNDYFLKNNMEAMLKDLEKRYEVYGKRE